MKRNFLRHSMRVGFACLLVSAAGNKLHAQTFSAVILDSQTRQPLPAASITVKGNGISNTILTANNKGLAVLKIPHEGQYNIAVSYIGYKTLDSNLMITRQQDKLEILLSPDINNLKGITAVAKKPYLVMNKGKMVLNVSESALAGTGNAWDALKYAPTVESSVNGKLTVRAQSATIYIDGRRIYLSGDELMQYLQTLNAAEVDQIEVIHHPGPAYPADVQTVISIKTKRLRSRGVRNTFMLAGVQGIYPRYNITERIDASTRSIDLQGGYSFTHITKGTTSHYQTLQKGLFPWDVSQYNKTRQDYHKAYANIAVRLPGESLLSFYGELPINNSDGVTTSGNGAPTADRIIKGDSVFRFSSSVDNKIKMPFLQVSYEKKWDSSRQSIKLQTEYFYNKRRYNNVYDISNFKGNDFIREQLLKDSLPQQLKTFVQSGVYTRQFLGGEISSGVRYAYTRLNNDNETTSLLSGETINRSNLVYQERNYALFSTWSKEKGPLYYEAGLRYENNQVTASNNGIKDSAAPSVAALLPSALLQWQLSEAHALVFSYKRGIVKPDYFQLNSFSRYTDNSTATFKGNQSIRPQINNTIDLTWQAGPSLNISAGAQLISNFINVLFLVDEHHNLYQQYSNFKRANLYYMSASWNTALSSYWQVRFNINSLFADVQYGTIKHDIGSPSFNASYVNSFSVTPRLKIETGVTYNNTYSDGFFRHAEYATADIAIRQQIPSKNLTISLSGATTFGPNESNRAVYNNIHYSDRVYHDVRFVRAIITWTFGKQTIKNIKKQTSASEDDQKRIKEKI
jgi:hypothetical protein